MKARIIRTSDYAWVHANPDKSPHEKAVWEDEVKEWVCEVKTIDDVFSFGDPIVLSSYTKKDGLDIEIEIYDAYRE